MKQKRIYWLCGLVFLAGIAAAVYSYTGPKRTVTSTYTTNERRICYWEATNPDVPSGQTCFLKMYYAPEDSCPYLDPRYNQGYFNANDCRAAWQGLYGCPASGGRLCSIAGPDTWTEDCTPGQRGCTSVQHTTTTNYPPATVSGTTSCSQAGNNGWCRGTASLILASNEPLSGYSITGIESSLGMLCSGPSCTWTFPEGNTSLAFWALSTYGDTSLQSSAAMKVDTVPPTLSILPSGGTAGDHGWFISGPVVALASASDDTSGVAGVSFNGGGSTFTASTDGVYPLVVVATDNAGNSASDTMELRLDSTPPALSVSASPQDGDNGWYLSAATVNALASDLTSGLGSVQFQLDTEGWQDGSEASVGTEGIHTVRFQAYDLAGNLTISSPLTFQLDFTPPNTDASFPDPDGQNGWFVSPVTIAADSSDAVSGLASQGVSLDGTSWTPSLSISSDGIHSIQVQAQDFAGNAGSATRTVRLDATPPQVEFILPVPDGDNSWYIGSVTVRAGGEDVTSGVASAMVSLDSSTWVDNLTLSEDGIYTVSARVSDNAGNTTTVSRIIQIDHTDPILFAPVLTGTPGLSGWYTSSVDLVSDASDVTSGLASLLYSVDGGTWQSGPLSLTDGRHTVQIQATDLAGNIDVTTQVVDVDSVPPASGFIAPVEGSVTFAHGQEFAMRGNSSDATSGLSEAQISLDGGLTWLPIPLAPDGSWAYTWDTTGVPNGSHVVLVEAGDLAGNQEHTARITVIVANLGPSVSMPDSFWVYQRVAVSFSAGFLPITGARIVISDGGEHTHTYSYSGNDLPDSFQWDGKWEDGSWARPGSYQVNASTWDMFSTGGAASATVRVPSPTTRTPSPTPTQTPSSTVTPTTTLVPTQQVSPTVTPEPQGIVIPEEPSPIAPSKPVFFWPVIGFVGLLAALASASLSDPRPRALRRLAQTLDSIQDDQPL